MTLPVAGAPLRDNIGAASKIWMPPKKTPPADTRRLASRVIPLRLWEGWTCPRLSIGRKDAGFLRSPSWRPHREPGSHHIALCCNGLGHALRPLLAN